MDPKATGELGRDGLRLRTDQGSIKVAMALNLEVHWRAKTHASGTNSQILNNDNSVRLPDTQVRPGSMQVHLELDLFDRRLTIVPGHAMDGGRADST